MWDTIRSEIPGQCKGTAGQFCCILKTKCTKIVPKNGDTTVYYGSAEVPAVPPVPGAGCVLHSGAPAVQQCLLRESC